MQAKSLTLTLAIVSGLLGCTPPPPRATVIANRVLVQDGVGHEVRSLDAETGKPVAKFPFEGWADGLDSSGRLVFIHGANGLAARDIDSGAVKWRIFMKLGYGWRAVSGGGLVFAPQWQEEKPAWVGFDAATGSRRFEIKSDRWAPLAANGDVAVTLEKRSLVGYSLADGKERWRSEIEARPPVFIEGNRLFARIDDEIGVFTASSGALRRKLEPEGSSQFIAFRGSRPQMAANSEHLAWVAGDTLRVANLESGKIKWTRPESELLAMTDDVVVTNDGPKVVGLDPATGKVKWRFEADDDPEGISAADGLVTIRTDGLSVVDAKTGKSRFKLEL
jgi:outer membrane protein assembly factor BamB